MGIEMAQARRLITKQLGELLIEKGIINQAQLDKALKVQKDKGGLIGQIFVMLGYVKEEEIAQALTVQYGFPYLPLESYEISADMIKLIPENVAKQYNLIAIDKIGNLLTISMSNPLNIQAIEDVEMLSGCNVQVFISTMTDISNAIKKYYGKT